MRARLERDGVEALHAELARRDPAIGRTPEAARPHPHRARARSGRGHRPFADRLASRRPAAAVAAGQIRALFLAPDRDELYARIDARFDAMLAAGALEEVAALAARRLDPLLPAMKAHGVPALIRHLEGEITLRGGGRDRPRRHPPLRQAAVHLVPAPAAGIRMGEAGGRRGGGCRPLIPAGADAESRIRLSSHGRIAQNSSRRTAGNPAKLENRAARRLPLTSGFGGYVRATFGKSERPYA